MMETNKTLLTDDRRKHLMKKLYKVKYKRKYENNSFCDMASFYESKLRRMRGNNMELAKALSEQRQLSQSWFEEVVSLKADLQESNQKSIGHQLAQSGCYESAINHEVSQKLQEVYEPLEPLINESLSGLLGLVENLTKIKTLFSSLRMSASNGRLSNPLNHSRNSLGKSSRPPLSKTPRSPRKNVVHPMVEGHVLQPATITIPRVTLDDQRRYRLHARERRMDMSIIGEVTTLPVEEEEEGEESHHSSASVNEEPSETPLPEATGALEEPPPGVEEDGETNSSQMETTTPKSPKLHFPPENQNGMSIKVGIPLKVEEEKKEPTNDRQITEALPEDPLEGPSWLYKKKSRGRKRKAKAPPRAPKVKGKRNYNPHLGMFSDSDSDEDDCPSQITRESSPSKNKVPSKQNEKVDLSSPSKMGDCLPESAESDSKPPKSPKDEIPFLSMEHCKGRVSRRNKNSSKSRFSAKSPQSEVQKSLECIRPSKVAMQSFIITDDTTNLKSLQSLIDLKDLETPCPLVAKSSKNQVSPLKGVVSDDPCCNSSQMSNESMEMTECIASLNAFEAAVLATHQSSPPLDSKEFVEIAPSKSSLADHAKPSSRKFFAFSSTSDQSPCKVSEKTPFDITLLDATVNIHPLLFKSGQNLPSPSKDSPLKSEQSFNLKDVSIVVKDIMKDSTPPPTVESAVVSPNPKIDQESDNDKENSSPIKRKGRPCIRPSNSSNNVGLRKSSRVPKPKVSLEMDISPIKPKRKVSKKKQLSLGKISNSLFDSKLSSAAELLPNYNDDMCCSDDLHPEQDLKIKLSSKSDLNDHPTQSLSNVCLSNDGVKFAKDAPSTSSSIVTLSGTDPAPIYLKSTMDNEVREILTTVIDLELEEQDPLAIHPSSRLSSPSRKVLDPLSNKSLAPPLSDLPENVGSDSVMIKAVTNESVSMTGRLRRPNQPISFKEPSVNRKMRRGD